MSMDLLSDILAMVALKGTLYFKTSFTAPWSIKVPEYENVARFHYAHKGRCYVRVAENESAISLEQGDLLIIWGGVEHVIFCDPKTEHSAKTLETILSETGFNGQGWLNYGEFGTDHETQLICGHFAFNDRLNHPLFTEMPSHIHIQNYGIENGALLENTLRLIGNEAGSEALGVDLIASKLSEIIFAQALRAYLQSSGAKTPGLAVFMDDNIISALTAIHKKPAHSWNVESLAKEAGMSRTNFSNRFLELVTMSPFKYLTYWRMQLAQQALVNTNLPIIEIAQNVGYNSEEAFSRSFKNMHAFPPATFRRNHKQTL